MNPLPPNQHNSTSLLITFSSGLVVITSVVLLFTNPSERRYEEFATEQLVIYAKENICSANSGNLEQAIKSQVCNLMIDTGRNKIPELITEKSQRKNYLLFSIYETDLFLYEFQTIGIFNSFYILDVQEIL